MFNFDFIEMENAEMINSNGQYFMNVKDRQYILSNLTVILIIDFDFVYN